MILTDESPRLFSKEIDVISGCHRAWFKVQCFLSSVNFIGPCADESNPFDIKHLGCLYDFIISFQRM
jgi:hypothetical protein